MNFLSPHKFWLATLFVAIALTFLSSPLLGYLHDQAAHHLAELQAEHKKTQMALQRLDDDIAMTKKLSGQIGAADVEKSLAYGDRLQAADALEHEAASARLSHFVYTVSPEERTSINNPGADVQQLAVSTISMKADAPLDTDAYAFIEHARTAMPGRMRLQSLILERTGAEGAPPAIDNLRMEADFEWLSNGVGRQMAESR